MTQHLLFDLATAFVVVVALAAGLVAFKRQYIWRLSVASLAGGLSVALLAAGYWLNVKSLNGLLDWSNGRIGSQWDSSAFGPELYTLSGWANLPQWLYDGLFIAGLIVGVTALLLVGAHALSRWEERINYDAATQMLLPAPAGLEPQDQPTVIRRPGSSGFEPRR